MDFPAEDEPDGNVLAPHHFYIGIIVASFSFLFVWPVYPVTGASGAILGTVLIVDDVLSHVFGWSPISWVWKSYVRPHVP